MCVIFWQANQAKHSLLLAANRDEFLARPTTSAGWHSVPTKGATCGAPPEPGTRVLSGLDVAAGGTWLGLSIPAGGEAILKFSTLTNIAETHVPSSVRQPSRGGLVSDFLSSAHASPRECIAALEQSVSDYAGFNLLCGQLSRERGFEMAYTTNRTPGLGKGAVLEGGAHVRGLSNATLAEEPRWPKVDSGCRAMKDLVESVTGEDALVAGLWKILSNSHTEPVSHRSHLRHTILIRPVFFNPSSMVMPSDPLPFPPSSASPPPPEDFPREDELGVEGEGGMWYGTRVQTVVLIEKVGEGFKVLFIERDGYVLGANGRPSWSGEERRYEFEL